LWILNQNNPMKICLIVNPNAGPGTFEKQVHKAARYLIEFGYEVEQVFTKAKGDATLLARQAAQAGFDVAVAVGGDGTINEICNGLAGSQTALGVLPAGTANVYAADVRIPIWHPLNPDAVKKAAQIIATGYRRRIDLGRVKLADGACRYFLMWCGIGLDAAITQTKRSSDKARSLNYAAWLVSGLMVTYDFMGTPAVVTSDNGIVRERVIMAVVSNGQLYGRVWRPAPEAKMDDGFLDVCIMTGHRWPSTVKHVLGLTFRRHVMDPDFLLYRTTRLSLSAREALPVHVDAETIGVTPIEIEVAPLVLTVILPHNAPARLFQAPAQLTP